MTIEINDSKTVQHIQDEFAGRFPFLKLEFFYTSHEWEEVSNETPCRPEQTLGEIRKHHVLGIITINPDSMTGIVEQEFKQRFDLNVQIYRRQASKWIQTTHSDMLTLSEQSNIADENAPLFGP